MLHKRKAWKPEQNSSASCCHDMTETGLHVGPRQVNSTISAMFSSFPQHSHFTYRTRFVFSSLVKKRHRSAIPCIIRKDSIFWWKLRSQDSTPTDRMQRTNISERRPLGGLCAPSACPRGHGKSFWERMSRYFLFIPDDNREYFQADGIGTFGHWFSSFRYLRRKIDGSHTSTPLLAGSTNEYL